MSSGGTYRARVRVALQAAVAAACEALGWTRGAFAKVTAGAAPDAAGLPVVGNGEGDLLVGVLLPAAGAKTDIMSTACHPRG